MVFCWNCWVGKVGLCVVYELIVSVLSISVFVVFSVLMLVWYECDVEIMFIIFCIGLMFGICM